MGRPGSDANQSASDQYTNWENSALNNYNSEMGGYNDQLSEMEGQGDPYTSKTFLQNQNKLTSAAMNSQNAAAKQQLQDTALRTGENTAAVQNTVASNARAGQRTLDTYNAGAANENEDKYLQYEQGLLGDRLAGAQSEAGIFGQDVSGRSNSDTNLANMQDANEQMWGNIVGSALGAAGTGAGIAAGGKV